MEPKLGQVSSQAAPISPKLILLPIPATFWEGSNPEKQINTTRSPTSGYSFRVLAGFKRETIHSRMLHLLLGSAAEVVPAAEFSLFSLDEFVLQDSPLMNL